MDEPTLRKLLEQIRAGKTAVDDAVRRLRDLPFAELGYATIDRHRTLRQGFPEVVLGDSKTPEQIVGIVTEMKTHGPPVLVTRLDGEKGRVLASRFPEGHYDATSRTFVIERPVAPLGKVAVVTAGTSDIPIAEEAAVTAATMGADVVRIYDVGVAGIHRLLAKRADIESARSAVVVAGMEGALASAVGGLVGIPVVAVPTSIGYGASFRGLAALLAMVNSCAPNVAVVNIDNGFGAGFYAALIARGATQNRSTPTRGGARRRRRGRVAK
jgi:pyridinium-3,5-biscarboxylic acid mononucleotide synthase